MGLLDGKNIVVTGVLTDASIAFGVADLALREGADVVLTGAGRGLSLTKRTARKLPVEARFIQKLFKLKYAHLSSIPWQFIESKTEAETAEIFGNSSILLALNARESFGLVPIEAMASGCIVVGFHGYGGLEYATPENGYWFSPEYMEEVADALAGVVEALERDDPSLVRMREAGVVTAARYTRSHTRDALSRFYQGICA